MYIIYTYIYIYIYIYIYTMYIMHILYIVYIIYIMYIMYIYIYLFDETIGMVDMEYITSIKSILLNIKYILSWSQ